LADAAVTACGLLDAANVEAVEFKPVTICYPSTQSRSPCISTSYSLQATENDLQAFHSDDYLVALKTAHSRLSARDGSKDFSELEDFGL
jgi:hypothetical protein